MIVVNTVVIGIEVDWRDEAPQFFQICEYAFAAIFFLEMCVRLHWGVRWTVAAPCAPIPLSVEQGRWPPVVGS